MRVCRRETLHSSGLGVEVGVGVGVGVAGGVAGGVRAEVDFAVLGCGFWENGCSSVLGDPGLGHPLVLRAAGRAHVPSG